MDGDEEIRIGSTEADGSETNWMGVVVGCRIWLTRTLGVQSSQSNPPSVPCTKHQSAYPTMHTHMSMNASPSSSSPPSSHRQLSAASSLLGDRSEFLPREEMREQSQRIISGGSTDMREHMQAWCAQHAEPLLSQYLEQWMAINSTQLFTQLATKQSNQQLHVMQAQLTQLQQSVQQLQAMLQLQLNAGNVASSSASQLQLPQSSLHMLQSKHNPHSPTNQLQPQLQSSASVLAAANGIMPPPSASAAGVMAASSSSYLPYSPPGHGSMGLGLGRRTTSPLALASQRQGQASPLTDTHELAAAGGPAALDVRSLMRARLNSQAAAAGVSLGLGVSGASPLLSPSSRVVGGGIVDVSSGVHPSSPFPLTLHRPLGLGFRSQSPDYFGAPMMGLFTQMKGPVAEIVSDSTPAPGEEVTTGERVESRLEMRERERERADSRLEMRERERGDSRLEMREREQSPNVFMHPGATSSSGSMGNGVSTTANGIAGGLPMSPMTHRETSGPHSSGAPHPYSYLPSNFHPLRRMSFSNLPDRPAWGSSGGAHSPALGARELSLGFTGSSSFLSPSGPSNLMMHGGMMQSSPPPPIGPAVGVLIPGVPLQANAPQIPPTGPIDILVVEDVRVAQKLAHATLTRAHYRVDIASSGEQALERIRFLREQHPVWSIPVPSATSSSSTPAQTYVGAGPKIVLMDITLPGMSGVETTERIRKLEAQASANALAISNGTDSATTQPPPCLIFGLTGNVDPQDLQRYRAAGMNGCIVKGRLLVESVKQALEEVERFPGRFVNLAEREPTRIGIHSAAVSPSLTLPSAGTQPSPLALRHQSTRPLLHLNGLAVPPGGSTRPSPLPLAALAPSQAPSHSPVSMLSSSTTPPSASSHAQAYFSTTMGGGLQSQQMQQMPMQMQQTNSSSAPMNISGLSEPSSPSSRPQSSISLAAAAHTPMPKLTFPLVMGATSHHNQHHRLTGVNALVGVNSPTPEFSLLSVGSSSAALSGVGAFASSSTTNSGLALASGDTSLSGSLGPSMLSMLGVRSSEVALPSSQQISRTNRVAPDGDSMLHPSNSSASESPMSIQHGSQLQGGLHLVPRKLLSLGGSSLPSSGTSSPLSHIGGVKRTAAMMLDGGSNPGAGMERSSSSSLTQAAFSQSYSTQALHHSGSSSGFCNVQAPVALSPLDPGLAEGFDVLLVEDVRVAQRVAQRALQSSGYRVDVASSGEAALERFKLHIDSLRIVLMDINLPGMSGVEATEMIRAHERSLGITDSTGRSRAPVLIFGLTGNTEHANLRLYEQAGMNGCIAKGTLLGSAVRAAVEASSTTPGVFIHLSSTNVPLQVSIGGTMQPPPQHTHTSMPASPSSAASLSTAQSPMPMQLVSGSGLLVGTREDCGCMCSPSECSPHTCQCNGACDCSSSRCDVLNLSRGECGTGKRPRIDRSQSNGESTQLPSDDSMEPDTRP